MATPGGNRGRLAFAVYLIERVHFAMNLSRSLTLGVCGEPANHGSPILFLELKRAVFGVSSHDMNRLKSKVYYCAECQHICFFVAMLEV